MADHRMSICAVSPPSKFGLRRPSSNYKSLIRISVCVGSIIIVMASALILSSKSEHKSFLDIKESFLEGKNIARSPRLFSWVNSFDDGKGVTTAGQHGGTQIISGCDAGSKNVIIETIKLTENGWYKHLQMILTAPITCREMLIIKRAFGLGLGFSSILYP